MDPADESAEKLLERYKCSDKPALHKLYLHLLEAQKCRYRKILVQKGIQIDTDDDCEEMLMERYKDSDEPHERQLYIDLLEVQKDRYRELCIEDAKKSASEVNSGISLMPTTSKKDSHSDCLLNAVTGDTGVTTANETQTNPTIADRTPAVVTSSQQDSQVPSEFNETQEIDPLTKRTPSIVAPSADDPYHEPEIEKNQTIPDSPERTRLVGGLFHEISQRSIKSTEMSTNSEFNNAKNSTVTTITHSLGVPSEEGLHRSPEIEEAQSIPPSAEETPPVIASSIAPLTEKPPPVIASSQGTDKQDVVTQSNLTLEEKTSIIVTSSQENSPLPPNISETNTRPTSTNNEANVIESSEETLLLNPECLNSMPTTSPKIIKSGDSQFNAELRDYGLIATSTAAKTLPTKESFAESSHPAAVSKEGRTINRIAERTPPLIGSSKKVSLFTPPIQEARSISSPRLATRRVYTNQDNMPFPAELNNIILVPAPRKYKVVRPAQNVTSRVIPADSLRPISYSQAMNANRTMLPTRENLIGIKRPAAEAASTVVAPKRTLCHLESPTIPQDVILSSSTCADPWLLSVRAPSPSFPTIPQNLTPRTMNSGTPRNAALESMPLDHMPSTSAIGFQPPSLPKNRVRRKRLSTKIVHDNETDIDIPNMRVFQIIAEVKQQLAKEKEERQANLGASEQSTSHSGESHDETTIKVAGSQQKSVCGAAVTEEVPVVKMSIPKRHEEVYSLHDAVFDKKDLVVEQFIRAGHQIDKPRVWNLELEGEAIGHSEMVTPLQGNVPCMQHLLFAGAEYERILDIFKDADSAVHQELIRHKDFINYYIEKNVVPFGNATILLTKIIPANDLKVGNRKKAIEFSLNAEDLKRSLFVHFFVISTSTPKGEVKSVDVNGYMAKTHRSSKTFILGNPARHNTMKVKFENNGRHGQILGFWVLAREDEEESEFQV